MRILLPVLVLVFGSAALDVAHAQWKWRDAGGQIHVSDLPPPREIADKDVLQRPSTTARAAAAPAATPAPAPQAASAPGTPNPGDGRPGVDPELEARRKAAQQEQQAQQRQDEIRLAAQRNENCDRARAALRQYESGMRLAKVNEKGERVVIDDKERAVEIQRAKQVVASDCR
jgi:hypothetical protein